MSSRTPSPTRWPATAEQQQDERHCEARGASPVRVPAARRSGQGTSTATAGRLSADTAAASQNTRW